VTATRLFARSVIRLSPQEDGEDVRGFLQGLVTNDVSGSEPIYAGLLTPQGKSLFDFIIWPADGDSGAFLIDCEAEFADDLVSRLSLYRLRRKIDIARVDDLAVHWSPDAPTGVKDPRLAALGLRWISPASSSDQPADEDWLRHRLALGVPEGRAELGDILWLETNAVELNGVSFDKGCYIGQENTARMNWRSKVNRRLVVVPLDRSNEKRRRAAYPDLGFAIDHLRLEDIAPAALQDWQAGAIAN
jgi:folate-binding protein YgfZ